MRYVPILLALLMLTGCPGTVRPTPPPPAVLEVPVRTYVPIDRALTKRCAWERNGKLVDMPVVARGRKTCLEKYEAQFDAIERQQGSPASN